MIGLPEDFLSVFSNGKDFCNKERKITQLDGWYADENFNYIVQCIEDPPNGYTHGQNISKTVIYNTPITLNKTVIYKIISTNISKYYKGIMDFELSNLYQQTARDFIYLSLYKNRPLPGVVVHIPDGWFVILQHNRFICRTNIKSLN